MPLAALIAPAAPTRRASGLLEPSNAREAALASAPMVDPWAAGVIRVVRAKNWGRITAEGRSRRFRAGFQRI